VTDPAGLGGAVPLALALDEGHRSGAERAVEARRVGDVRPQQLARARQVERPQALDALLPRPLLGIGVKGQQLVDAERLRCPDVPC
jgi:hypothetical protein